MKLVKLSTGQFESEDKLQDYFDNELPKKQKGKFFFNKGIGARGLKPDEIILFSYQAKLRYVANAETGRRENESRGEGYFSNFIRLKMPIRKANVSLDEVKRKLEAKANLKTSFKGQGWTIIPDSKQAEKIIEDFLFADAPTLPAKIPAHRAASTNPDIQSEKVHVIEKKPKFEPKIVDAPKNHTGGYKVQTKSAVIKAEKIEAKLLDGYRAWLEKKNRELSAVKYGTLECDGYEVKRRNLIEAKASTRREHIRMAVGQLLDYAFQGKQGMKPLGEPNKAVLLPKKPDAEIVNWLQHLHISIIWREGKSFSDNADGQFS